MFENVTYSFYSDVLGRSVIPSAEEFDALKLTNIQEVKALLPYLVEREENGIVSAVCMRMEKEYMYNKSGNEAAVNSESLSGHSVTYDMSVKTKLVKPLEESKMEATKLFCFVKIGVR